MGELSASLFLRLPPRVAALNRWNIGHECPIVIRANYDGVILQGLHVLPFNAKRPWVAYSGFYPFQTAHRQSRQVL